MAPAVSASVEASPSSPPVAWGRAPQPFPESKPVPFSEAELAAGGSFAVIFAGLLRWTVGRVILEQRKMLKEQRAELAEAKADRLRMHQQIADLRNEVIDRKESIGSRRLEIEGLQREIAERDETIFELRRKVEELRQQAGITKSPEVRL